MIKSLINDVSQCKFLLIEDSINQRDDSLFYSCLKARCNEPCVMEVFLFEHSEEQVENLLQLKKSTKAKVKYHDFHTNATAWITSQEAPDKNLYDKLLHDVISSTNGTKKIVVTDNVLAFGFDHNEIGHSLFWTKSRKNVVQIIMIVHRELIPEENLKKLHYLAQGRIRMSASTFKPVVDSDKIIDVCEVMYKRSNGKVLNQKEMYTIRDDFKVDSKVWVPPEDDEFSAQDAETEDSKEDQFKEVTFNLNLTKKERQDKEALVLPYTKQKENLEANSSKIFYEPDDADDFDDEDPDEDLEF